MAYWSNRLITLEQLPASMGIKVIQSFWSNRQIIANCRHSIYMGTMAIWGRLEQLLNYS
jgi:hypothetical protein